MAPDDDDDDLAYLDEPDCVEDALTRRIAQEMTMTHAGQ